MSIPSGFRSLFRHALIFALATLLLVALAVPLAAIPDADESDEEDLAENGQAIRVSIPDRPAGLGTHRYGSILSHASSNWDRPPPSRPIA